MGINTVRIFSEQLYTVVDRYPRARNPLKITLSQLISKQRVLCIVGKQKIKTSNI